MLLTSRPYQHPQDFATLAAFLSHARSAIYHAHYLHVGDLTWQLFHMLAAYRPADLVQLWEDRSQQLLGFALRYPPFGFFDVQLDPQHRGGSLEAEMFEWVEQQLRPAATLHTLVNNQDTARVRLLAQHGYRPNGEWFYLERLLNDALPQPEAPAGFVLRSLASITGGAGEVQAVSLLCLIKV